MVKYRKPAKVAKFTGADAFWTYPSGTNGYFFAMKAKPVSVLTDYSPVFVDWLPDGTKVERPATDEEIARFWSSWLPAEGVCRCAENTEKFVIEGCTCPKESK